MIDENDLAVAEARRPAPWPDPDAPRAAVDAFVASLTAAPAPAEEPQHEAPPVANGPSLVCNACGVVRVSLFTPFCKGCLAQMPHESLAEFGLAAGGAS